jgi:hypothetical protein
LTKLAQGRGNLIRRAEQLRGLGVAPGKRLPGPLLDLSGEDDADPAQDSDADAGGSADGSDRSGH